VPLSLVAAVAPRTGIKNNLRILNVFWNKLRPNITLSALIWQALIIGRTQIDRPLFLFGQGQIGIWPIRAEIGHDSPKTKIKDKKVD